MSIKRGSSNIKRHARNYTGQQADARLKEVIGAVQQQSTNALMVDSFEIKYYQQAKSTTICTCKQTSIASNIAARIVDPESNVPVTMMKEDSTVGKSIRIDYNRPLFGTPVEQAKADDTDIDSDDGDDFDDFDLDEDDDSNDSHTPTETVDATFSNGKDCGICYRAGYVPGYHAYGFERTLLTTHNIAEVYGYTIDLTTAPHTIRQQDKREGYVDFEINVPKYFNAANISVRNNIEILDDSLFIAGPNSYPLTFSALHAVRGGKIKLRVRAHAFTHVVIEFDLGTEKLRANLAQMSKTVDWTLFDTLGNIQMVLPPTIQNIAGNDVIYVPSRAMTFKVTDVTYMRTANESNLDWPVSTRILQPQESLGRIHRSFKLY
jgi:hypothetical protein